MLEITFIGNLGRNADVKIVNGHSVCFFEVAVNDRQRNEQGGYERLTRWIDCTMSERSAEFTKWLSKGTLVYVRGRLDVSAYQYKSTDLKVNIRCYVDRVELLSSTYDPLQQQPLAPDTPAV